MNTLVIFFAYLTTMGSAFGNTPMNSYSFKGEIRQGARSTVHFVVKGPLIGRDTSYLAFVFREKPHSAEVYMMDPDGKGTYALTPIQMTDDGEIGIQSVEPRYVLTPESASNAWNPFQVCASDRPDNLQAFKVMAANPNSSQEAMVFNGRCDSRLVMDFLAGQYCEADKRCITIRGLDAEREARVAFAGVAGLSGNYVMRLKQPSLYAFRAEVMSSKGSQLENFPRKLGVFLREYEIFGKDDKIILIDPANSTKLNVLKRK